jgi:DNA-binding GntR family transcriptional regulator
MNPPRRPSPIKPPTIARERFLRIYGTLRDRICMLEYAPGTRLSEEELAAEFAVSRTPIRRVLSRLEAEGLVLSHHGVGTIVTDVDIEALSQVFELRMELETLLGKLSPVSQVTDNISRSRNLFARCDELAASPDPMKFARLNMEFFFELTALTDNEQLRQTAERLFFQTTRIWLKTVPVLNLSDEIRIFRGEIEDVLSAVEIGDLAAVGHIRRSQISLSFARMRRYSRAAAANEDTPQAG